SAAPPTAGLQRTTSAERKQATVLYIGLQTRTADGDAVDPESLHLVYAAFLAAAREAVERYGGRIHQAVGDRIMALFGAPITLEDHAHRAVMAALALREQGTALSAAARGDAAAVAATCTLRFGMATGGVVFGGAGDVVVGEAVDLARRLEGLAVHDPQADADADAVILVQRAAGQLVWPFVRLLRARDLEATHADDRLGRLYRVVGPRERERPTVFAQVRLTPFVGRERELQTLRLLADQAGTGRGQAVGIAGQAGTGKSRLIFEFRRQLRSQSVTWLSGTCLAYGQGTPYLPLLSMVRRASYIGRSDAPGAIASKLRDSLEAIGLEADSALPFLLRLLGIELGAYPVGDLEPQAIQAQTFAILRRMVLRAGQQSLVVLEIEDLHWIDQTSEAFLASLVEGMAGARLLLLATYRAGYRPSWLERSYATQLSVHPLSPEEGREMAAAILQTRGMSGDAASDDAASGDDDGGGGRDDGALVADAEALLAKAEGNPFFLEELARQLTDLRSAETSTGGAPQGDGAIPDTVQGVLMARIDRLPAEHKQLLQIASVLQRELSVDLLGRLWDGTTPLVQMLRDLTAWEFFYESATETGSHYVFRHALTQEVAYASLLSQHRQQLHAATAEALEALHASRLADVYDQLIYHYARAGRPVETVRYAIAFADQAAASYAHAEAARALREALKQAEALPAAHRDAQILDLVLRLAASLLPLAGFFESLERLEGETTRVERLDDAQLRGRY
ncbi:MAG: AAA family ATPase, partial [Acidobacteriota bacterium]